MSFHDTVHTLWTFVSHHRDTIIAVVLYGGGGGFTLALVMEWIKVPDDTSEVGKRRKAEWDAMTPEEQDAYTTWANHNAW
jgi:hypothetical protein